jgi:N-acetylmuramoyl-L-alanine amidase
MKKLIAITTVFLTALFLSFTSEEKTVIVLDVGHGGKDSGAVTEKSVLEKDVTFKIAQKIQQLNENPNLEIKLTRNSDEFMTIEDRVKYISNVKPNYVISLHANFNSDTNLQGVELFYSENSEFAKGSKELAHKLKKELEGEMKIQKTSKANFAVLHNASCPAVMIETGFLSNEKDLAFLTSEAGQTKMAKKILLSLK